MTFSKPPKLRELGEACDQSYWSVRRMVLAGVVPVLNFPDGERIDLDWANRYVRQGLTDSTGIRVPGCRGSPPEYRG
jgi:hypothetical protein